MAEYISREAAVGAGYLSDWYISSVGDESPVWTDAHIDELLNDFIVIPKDTKSADVQLVNQWQKLTAENEKLKRILKNAMSDIYKKCSCDNFDCDICEREACDYDDRFTWRLEEEAFDLIYKRGDAE